MFGLDVQCLCTLPISKQAGVELGLTQAETVSLELKGSTKISLSCVASTLQIRPGKTLDK